MKMMRERDYVNKKAISSGSKELWGKYKKQTNKQKNKKKKPAQKNYYQKCLHSKKGL